LEICPSLFVLAPDAWIKVLLLSLEQDLGGAGFTTTITHASMGIEPLFGDTLMPVSGNIMKDALKEALGQYLESGYIRPRSYVDEE
jgi:hypothetical protein